MIKRYSYQNKNCSIQKRMILDVDISLVKIIY